MRIRVALACCYLLIPFLVRAQSSAPRSKILGLTFVRIKVTDTEAASHFYGGELHLARLDCCCFGENSTCFFVTPYQQLDLIKTEAESTRNLIAAVGMSISDAKSLRNYLLARGESPGEIITDSQGTITFQTTDPEQHVLEFVQFHKGVADSDGDPPPISNHMIHAGFIVKDRVAMDKFYRDILGFHLYWSGGMKDGETNWVSMQVPDGTDWIEYMLNVDSNADQRLRGVMNHVALGVPNVKEAAIQLEKSGVKLTEQPKIGRDGKWQLNVYDPDMTRVELMEFTPVEKPCCSEFTGTHPKP
jgi:catechol 2,3-dioxygenase-like lactoylglutathione lyase family enzyme